MPVVSPSRFSSASSASLSSGSYRSPLSSSSLDRPYYSSATSSYIPRSSTRSTYTERSSTSVSEYRSHRYGTYDSEVVRERKSSYCSEYGRYGRAPSVSDSDSGVSGVSGASRLASRSDRSSPRSRDTSVTRSESARTTRSEPLPRPYLTSSTAELYNKYSPANYVPLAQRLSTAVTGPNGESTRSKNISGDAARLPPTRRPLRAQEPERLRSARQPTDSKGKPASTIIPRARLPSTWNDKKSVSSHHSHTNGYRDSSLSISDDNGNDLPLTVSDIRRKFDPKMTVTRLPSRDPDLFYKTTLSSDNIYGQVMKHNSSISSLIDDKPVPVHKPISSDKYTNGTTGSLKWEFLSPSPSPVKESKDSSESGYLSKKSTDSGSDVSSVYLSGKLSDDRKSLNSVKNQLNANNVIGKILEKSTTIYVGNDEPKQTNDDSKYDRSDSSKNILSIEIGSSKQNNVQNETDDSLSPKDGTANNLDGSQGNESRSKHTSDFASYIQVSAPTSSPPNTNQKRYLNTLCNGDANSEIQDTMNESDLQRIKYSDEIPKVSACLLSPDENDSSNLRYIDSEPSLETDSKLIIDYNDKDDSVYEEEGFENKTFEHANGHLLRKNDDTDSLRKTKQNGIVKMVDDISDDEDTRVVRKAKEGDYNSNDRYLRDGSSPVPETPLSKRKYTDLNGETSPASMYQIYQKDSSSGKSSSPLNTSSPSSNSVSNNVNNSTCGTLTTSRRRSVDSKSPQPGGETLSKTSGLNGLRNIGNTCFMNSVVQCLSNTKPLLEYCGSPESFTPDINTTLSCMKGALIKAFSTVITELWKADETDGVVNTTSLKAQIQRFAPRFMGYSQQDAQEFLRYLLEGLHEDVNRVTVKPKPILTEIDDNLSDAQKAQESWQRYLRSEDSRVGDIFVGQLKSSLRCTHCSHTSVTFDPFWDLSLPIPSRTGQHKLTQCLSHFTREEELDGDEKPTCSKCQVRRKCLKWFTVQKFPKVLVLHLKRFSPTERFRGKLNVPVEFPLSGLDMTPYAASTTNNRGPPPPAAIYNLYAVSNHSGTTYSGHYTAYCKHPYNGEWHEYNDSRVSQISPKNVVSSEAYVLFYELASGSAAS